MTQSYSQLSHLTKPVVSMLTTCVAISCIVLCATFVFSPSAHAKEGVLVWGVTPWETPETLHAIHKPIMEHLSKQINRKIEFQVARDYDDLAALIKRNVVHVGIFSPVAYVRAKKSMPKLQYMATVLSKNQQGDIVDHYRGLIITRKDSKLTTLESLKGKRFAFTDKSSSSGYKYPSKLLAESGIDIKSYFGRVVFLKKHPVVTKALAAGSIDAGATWDGNYVKAVKEHGDIFHVVSRTPEIPFDACAASANLDPALVAAIQKTLFSMASDHPALKLSREHGGQRHGWAQRSDAFYNPVRTLPGLPLAKETTPAPAKADKAAQPAAP